MENEMIGAIAKAGVKTNQPAAQAPRVGGLHLPARTTSRIEFARMLATMNISRDIINGYKNGTLKLVDHTIFGVKPLGAVTKIDMIKPADAQVDGITNLNFGKLEKSQIFVCTGIGLLYGVKVSNADGKDVAFGKIPAVIRNGQWRFEANRSTQIVDSSCEDFNTDGTVEYPFVGVLRLENPILIASQTDIKLEAQWGVAAAADTFVKYVLKGAMLVKA